MTSGSTLRVHAPTVRQLLRERGLSAQKLAERMGASPPLISNILGGKAPLTSEMAFRIALELSNAPFVGTNSLVPPECFADSQAAAPAAAEVAA